MLITDSVMTSTRRVVLPDWHMSISADITAELILDEQADDCRDMAITFSQASRLLKTSLVDSDKVPDVGRELPTALYPVTGFEAAFVSSGGASG